MFQITPSRANIMEKLQIPMYSLQNTKKSFFIRKKIVILITFVIVIFLVYHYIINSQNELNMQPIIMHFEPVDNNISCHYVDEGDALPSAEDGDFSPKSDSIFFLETSCRGGLNSRQACGIESASRAHPGRQVYVMFCAPVSDDVYRRSSIATLRRLPNVKFARIHITDYAKNTPLEVMIAGNPFNKSNWRVLHTSDVLRLLVLYKWGGVYLDTDMLVVKSLSPLADTWLAREDEYFVANAAMAASTDAIGRIFIENIIDEVKSTFRPDLRTHNGPLAIDRVLERICDTDDSSKWSSNTCQGIEVYDAEYFYPLKVSKNKEYFKNGGLMGLDKAYTYHFWNYLSNKKKIEKDSPYAKLAREFCPKIYQMYGEEFGS